MKPILTGTFTLIEKTEAAHETIRFRFKPESITTLTGEPFAGSLDYEPGQFISLGFTETAWRAYSIASVPSEDRIEFVVRIIADGIGSQALLKANPGDSFPFKGPFGHFKLSENEGVHLVFCATGTGIAPFRSMIKHEAAQPHPRKMTLLYGGKNADDLAYLEELKQWSSELNIQLGLSRDPELELPEKVDAQAHHSRITDILELLELKKDTEFYLCGNGSMVQSVQTILSEKGIAQERIFMERFN